MAGRWGRSTTFAELIAEGALDIGDGYRAKNEELGGDGPIFLRAGHVTDSHIDFSGVERFHAELEPRVRSKFSKPGDAVVTTKGNSTGRTTFVTYSMPPFVYSPHLSYWRSKDRGRIEGGFLRYWSKGPEFSEQLAGMKTSTDMAPYLSLIDQKRLRVTLPPIDDQRAIAHILGTLDDKIELNRKMSEMLEAMARALFKSWFVDFDPVRAKMEGRDPGLPKDIADLFPSRLVESELGEIPEGWKAGPLAQFFKIGLGGAWGHDAQSKRATVAVQCLRGIDCHDLAEGSVPDVPVRWLSEKQVDDRKLQEGVILIEGSGSFCGRSLIWDSSYEALVGGHISYSNFCKRLDPLCGAAEAVVCWMQVRQAYRDGLLQSFRTGTAFPNLDVHGVLANLMVVVPPASLARKFVKVFALKRRLNLMAQSRALAALRDTLLPKLISGMLRISHAAEIPEG